jgi:2-iminobutanoate/2-iminopropanoate deaminase
MRLTGILSIVSFGLVASVASASAVAAQQTGGGSGKQVINPPNARPGVLSTAVKIGDLIYLSGALGTKPGGGGLADGGIAGQTRQALENVKSSVTLAGGTMADIVKCTVFLTDVKDFGGMNQFYREFFPTEPPARTTVAVAGLVVPGAVIEIECIAGARK